MKRIILISTFSNTEEKLRILKEKLVQLKKMGLDTMILTQFEIPFSVIELSTYCFITRENPIIKWPEFASLSRKDFFENGRAFSLVRGLSDYGFAHANQCKTLAKIALSYDYDVFYFMNYDLNINEAVIAGLERSDISCNLWPGQCGDWSSRATLNFMALNRENLIKLVEVINREQYVSNLIANPSDNAERWIEKLCEANLNPVFQTEPVTDFIRNYENQDQHDCSRIGSARMFIQKCNQERFEVKVIAYSYEGEKRIRIRTDFGEEEYVGLSPAIFTLAKESDAGLTSAIIEIDGESQELIDDIRSVDINQIILY